jgi:hypothetical protein
MVSWVCCSGLWCIVCLYAALWRVACGYICAYLGHVAGTQATSFSASHRHNYHVTNSVKYIYLRLSDQARIIEISVVFKGVENLESSMSLANIFRDHFICYYIVMVYLAEANL